MVKAKNVAKLHEVQKKISVMRQLISAARLSKTGITKEMRKKLEELKAEYDDLIW